MDLNPIGEGGGAEPHHCKRWIVQARGFGAAGKGYMDGMGHLGRRSVIGKSRKQADDSLGYASCHGGKIRVAEGREIGQAIQTPAHKHERPGIPQGVEHAGVDTGA
jgi:hypothetical protein